MIGTGIKAALDSGSVQVAAGEFGVNLFVIVVLTRVGGNETCRHQDCGLEAGGVEFYHDAKVMRQDVTVVGVKELRLDSRWQERGGPPGTTI